VNPVGHVLAPAFTIRGSRTWRMVGLVSDLPLHDHGEGTGQGPGVPGCNPDPPQLNGVAFGVIDCARIGRPEGDRECHQLMNLTCWSSQRGIAGLPATSAFSSILSTGAIGRCSSCETAWRKHRANANTKCAFKKRPGACIASSAHHIRSGKCGWMEMSHIWRKFAHRGLPPFMPWMMPFGGQLPPSAPAPRTDDTLAYLLDHSEEVMTPSEQLFVRRIEMASPGGFSFQGLGQPIEQLRELIKDLWYRNRQERQRGDLGILREKLALFSHLNLTVQQIDLICTHMSIDVRVLGELIESGKLSLGGEEPRSHSQPSLPTSLRVRRRKKKPD